MRISNDDHTLWQAFKNGDRKAFQSVYFTSYRSLYEYGMRIARDRHLVEDSIHDLFVKLWDHKANLSNISALTPYLLVSLRSSLFNKLERNSRTAGINTPDEWPFDLEFSVESKFIEKENDRLRRERLIKALSQLSSRQKEAIYLRYIQEMEYEEVAAIMKITLKGTYKLTARALDTLRHLLHLTNSSLLLLMSYFRIKAL